MAQGLGLEIYITVLCFCLFSALFVPRRILKNFAMATAFVHRAKNSTFKSVFPVQPCNKYAPFFGVFRKKRVLYYRTLAEELKVRMDMKL